MSNELLLKYKRVIIYTFTSPTINSWTEKEDVICCLAGKTLENQYLSKLAQNIKPQTATKLSKNWNKTNKQITGEILFVLILLFFCLILTSGTFDTSLIVLNDKY